MNFCIPIPSHKSTLLYHPLASVFKLRLDALDIFLDLHTPMEHLMQDFNISSSLPPLDFQASKRSSHVSKSTSQIFLGTTTCIKQINPNKYLQHTCYKDHNSISFSPSNLSALSLSPKNTKNTITHTQAIFIIFKLPRLDLSKEKCSNIILINLHLM